MIQAQLERSKSRSQESRAVANSIVQRELSKKLGARFTDNRNQANFAMPIQAKSGTQNAQAPIQREVLEERAGANGYWKAKKIKTNNEGTRWWQFRTGPNTYIKYDFQVNEIGDNTYQGNAINNNQFGRNPVIATADVESSEQSNHMEMSNGDLKPLSQVSDGAIFAAASRISGVQYKGKGYTWHHGKTLGEMYLLDTAIHAAFAPHRGWASEGGSRNEMSDFIVYDSDY